MPFVRAFNPVLHFDDDNGHPLAGGWLYTFLAGTDTPVATAANESGSSMNPVNIQLDRRGECVVWLNPALKYKFVVWNANKTWRQIKDNVSAPGVGSMPNVAITSPDGSINVGEATVDPDTNTKTIPIEVAHSSNSFGWFNTSNIDTQGGESSVFVERFRVSEGQAVLGNGVEFVPTETVEGVDFGNVYLNQGVFFLNFRLNVMWQENPVNKVCNVAGRQFDFSYQHEEKISSSQIVRFTARTKLSLNISLDDDIPIGLRIWVDRLQIFAINSGSLEVNGIQEVEHDESISGKGTAHDPLSIRNTVEDVSSLKLKGLVVSNGQLRFG